MENRVPIADEELWEYWRPRDKGNKDMGASPVTQLVMEGVDVPEDHVWRTVATRKGQVPRAPVYVDRTDKGWVKPAPWSYNVDWAEIKEMFE